MARPSNTEERRQQIVEGLLRVMAERGYERASIAEIAKAAGLSPGLVHYHFTEKQELAKPGATADDVFAGVRFIRNNPAILGTISLDLFAVLLGGVTALLPIYARDILFVGPEGLGLLRAAPAFGAALVALVMARRPLSRHAATASKADG